MEQDKLAKWQAYEEREAAMTEESYAARDEAMREVFRAFAAVRDADPASEEAQEAVRRWHMFIEENFYPCPRSVLAGLGQMFTGDAAFAETLESYGAGTSAFMTAAIAVYCRG